MLIFLQSRTVDGLLSIWNLVLFPVNTHTQIHSLVLPTEVKTPTPALGLTPMVPRTLYFLR